ncbi:MAG: DNA-binding protein [Oscillospiraceae bacterium]|nr:DNA-binding protein [Oscillospiraceae bacterium]
MLKKEKERIVSQIFDLLLKLTDDDTNDNVNVQAEEPPTEMLTIKECARAVRGVSEHSIRQIVAGGQVKSVRTGEGKRGKILVNKADLMAYFGA